MSICKWTKSKNYIDSITDISLFLFLIIKTGTIKQTIAEYCFLGIFILSVILKILSKKKLTITKQSIYYTIFGTFACISYFWAMNREFVKETIPSILALIIFIIALSNYTDSPEKFLKIVKYTVIANILVSIKIIILYGVYTGTAADRINSITGIYFNTVAQVIGFSIIFSIYLYKLYEKKIYAIMIVPQFIAIFLTESRKSMIIPILGIIIIMMLEKMTIKKITKCIIIVIIILIGVSVINTIGLDITSNITDKFGELFKYLFGQQTDDWSINLRQFFINTGIEIFKQHSIIGIGANNFAYYVENYTYYDQARYSHNNYIEMLSGLGMIGFILYYWFYIYLVIKLLRKVINDRKNINVSIALSAIIVLMIMEWGIVSYTGCMYHIYILIVYYILLYKDKLLLEEKKDGK